MPEVRVGSSVTILTFIICTPFRVTMIPSTEGGAEGGCVCASERMVTQSDVRPTFPTRHCNSAVGKTEKPHNMILCTL